MSTIENPADREAETDDWGACICPQCYQIRRITPDSSRQRPVSASHASEVPVEVPVPVRASEAVLPRRIAPAEIEVGMLVERRDGEAAFRGRVDDVCDGWLYDCNGRTIWSSGSEGDGWSLWLVEDAPEPVDPDADLIDSLAKAMWDAHADAAGYSEDDPWAYGDEGIRDEWRSDAREWIAAARSQGYRIEATR